MHGIFQEAQREGGEKRDKNDADARCNGSEYPLLQLPPLERAPTLAEKSLGVGIREGSLSSPRAHCVSFSLSLFLLSLSLSSLSGVDELSCVLRLSGNVTIGVSYLGQVGRGFLSCGKSRQMVTGGWCLFAGERRSVQHDRNATKFGWAGLGSRPDFSALFNGGLEETREKEKEIERERNRGRNGNMVSLQARRTSIGNKETKRGLFSATKNQSPVGGCYVMLMTGSPASNQSWKGRAWDEEEADRECLSALDTASLQPSKQPPPLQAERPQVSKSRNERGGRLSGKTV